MRKGVKRPIPAYAIPAFWIFFSSYNSTRVNSEFMIWFFRTAAAGFVVFLIYLLVRRNYFEVIGSKLFVNENIFKRRVFDLDSIEKFDIEPGPFTSSKIILKDGSKIAYSDNQTNDKKLKEFMQEFNIPVE